MPAPQMENAAALFGDARTPFLSAREVERRLGVTQSELAQLAGLSRNTLASDKSSRKVDDALSPLVRIIAMAAEMAGDEQRAAVWFKHQPIPGWAGKTAFDLVKEGKADKVLAYLEAVRSGVYA